MKKWSAIILLILLLTGCSASPKNAEHAGHVDGQQDEHGLADIQETTSSASILPSFLDNQPQQMKDIYTIAALNADLLSYIPCYCGCGVSAGHKSNKNCFIQTINSDGAIVWDDHGTKCSVCLEIAVVSAAMKKEGKSDLEIRETIDRAYDNGDYAPATDTPMPAM